MEITAESLDDILMKLYPILLKSDQHNSSRRGKTVELLGVTLRLTNPRARLSRSEDRGKLFSALGELLWYVAGSDDLRFIYPYIPTYKKDAVNGKINAAYGPRLFRMRDRINQLHNVSMLLSQRPGSRRAVVQIFDAADLTRGCHDVPCTTSLQFLLRNNLLHLSVTMRSNDAYLGVPHDVFCFSMIQEAMARHLNIGVGEYYHYVGSIHLYQDVRLDAQRYLEEGHQKLHEMPPMPGDPTHFIPLVLDAERKARDRHPVSAQSIDSEYWADIVRLLQAFWASGKRKTIQKLENEVVHPIYRPYIHSREDRQPPPRTYDT